MSGVLKIEIVESEATLLQLLSQQKTAKTQQRVQVLYWLKTKQANSVEHLAVMLGKHSTTISRWLSKYRQGGIKALLTIKSSPGRTPSIPPEILARLKEELSDPERFSSYGEIQTWLETVHNLKVSYKVVHDTVRYRLKAKLKVPRPVNIKQKAGAVDNFKKAHRTARAVLILKDTPSDKDTAAPSGRAPQAHKVSSAYRTEQEN